MVGSDSDDSFPFELVSFFGGILDTVDGRNPAPVDVVDVLVFIVFSTSQVVVWDF